MRASSLPGWSSSSSFTITSRVRSRGESSRIPVPAATGGEAESNRRPDIAFVSFERCPADLLPSTRENAWDVVPDLAIEVISPSDLAEEQLEKVLEYFQAGVRLVWVVYPTLGHLTSTHLRGQSRSLTGTDILDGGAPCCPDSRCR